jgi:Zn-finger nucleic acid-binding protein
MGNEGKPDKKDLFCPYCDEDIGMSDLAYCRACGVTIFYCPKCRKPVPRDRKVCPYCGVDIKG